MKASSDKIYDKYKDYDFSDAKPVAETPLLANLQVEAGGKPRITMRKVVVQPVHINFLRYRGSVKTGAGDIAADIQAGREETRSGIVVAAVRLSE